MLKKLFVLAAITSIVILPAALADEPAKKPNLLKEMGSGIKKSAAAVVKGTETMGKDLAKGTQKVSKNVVKGTKKGSKGLVKGTETVGKDLGKGTETVGKDLVKGTEKAEHAVGLGKKKENTGK